eukprot:CAMPEP_0114542710 /NCGR_PEP_ID=MMETSP0114-20121206/1974_1 /TAXON_ID=31324 /ORGANISM="Goniomonas sp, Strain m" /LENGTH=187 /DNA_ID=CAMNT_0001727013 /DNA_START=22 /DNA_END=585 /DNA_ORIENTATION=+
MENLDESTASAELSQEHRQHGFVAHMHGTTHAIGSTLLQPVAPSLSPAIRAPARAPIHPAIDIPIGDVAQAAEDARRAPAGPEPPEQEVYTRQLASVQSSLAQNMSNASLQSAPSVATGSRSSGLNPDDVLNRVLPPEARRHASGGSGPLSNPSIDISDRQNTCLSGGGGPAPGYVLDQAASGQVKA